MCVCVSLQSGCEQSATAWAASSGKLFALRFGGQQPRAPGLFFLQPLSLVCGRPSSPCAHVLPSVPVLVSSSYKDTVLSG